MLSKSPKKNKSQICNLAIAKEWQPKAGRFYNWA